MKKFSKILTLLLAVLLVLGNARVVSADPSTPPTSGEDSQYEPITGDKAYFDKYLVTNKGQEIPDVDFEYVIEPGEAVPYTSAKGEYYTFYLNGAEQGEFETLEQAQNAAKATVSQVEDKWMFDGELFPSKDEAEEKAAESAGKVDAKEGKFEIFAGIGNPEVSKAQFGETSPSRHMEKYEDVQEGDSIKPETIAGGKVYSKDTVSIDFSSVEFKEPGVYRYIITEKEIDDPDIYPVKYDTEVVDPDSKMVRVLDVYVVHDEDPVATETAKIINKTEGGVEQWEYNGTTYTSYTEAENAAKNAAEAKGKCLKIADYVLHETVTTIYTNEDMGSRDEKAEEKVVQRKWIIVDGLYDTVEEFDTLADAEAELARRRSKGYDAPNYDSDIKKAKEEWDDAIAAEAAAKAAYEAAERDEHIPDVLQPKVEEEQGKLDVLEDGTDPAPSGTIDEILATLGDSDESKYEDLKAFGYDKLLQALNTETDAKDIINLRLALDRLEAEIIDQKAALDLAEENLEAAKERIKPQKQAWDDAIQVKSEKEIAHAKAKERHDRAEVLEVVEKIWELSDKSDHYTNEISTFNLEFGKEVTGNQGSRDKYFKFTLKLTGLREAEEYYRRALFGETVGVEEADGTDAYLDKNGIPFDAGTKVVLVEILDSVINIFNDSTSSEDSNFTPAPTQTASTKYAAADMEAANSFDEDNDPNNGQQYKAENGVIIAEFYLKDGEYVVIKDLPAYIEYEVTEDSEDYKKTDGTDKVVEPEKPAITEAWLFNSDEYDNLGDALEALKKYNLENDPDMTRADVVHRQAKDGVPAKVHDDPTKGTLEHNIYTGFTNTRNGIIPTGVMAAAGTGALIVGAGIIGLVALSRRREEDEDE